MESYWRSAPTAEDFEQLVDPDAKAPCESANFDPNDDCYRAWILLHFLSVWRGQYWIPIEFGPKLQIVSSFGPVDVGSGAVKIRRRNTAWPR